MDILESCVEAGGWLNDLSKLRSVEIRLGIDHHDVTVAHILHHCPIS